MLLLKGHETSEIKKKKRLKYLQTPFATSIKIQGILMPSQFEDINIQWLTTTICSSPHKWICKDKNPIFIWNSGLWHIIFLSLIINLELAKLSCFVEVYKKLIDLQMGKKKKRKEQVAVVSKARICVGCRWNSSRGCHLKWEVGFEESYRDTYTYGN